MAICERAAGPVLGLPRCAQGQFATLTGEGRSHALPGPPSAPSLATGPLPGHPAAARMTGPDGWPRRVDLRRWLKTARGQRQPRVSERVRRRQPLPQRRLSVRPRGDGAAEHHQQRRRGRHARFWVMVIACGIAAGPARRADDADLFNVQYAVFRYHEGSLEHGVMQASAARPVSSLLIAGAFGGVARFLLRRYTKGKPSEIDEALWNGDARLSFRRSLGSSAISEVVIGMGASIGREAAPKLLGGASGSVLSGLGRPVGGAAAAARGVRRRRRALLPSTTFRSPAPCSPPRSSSGASPCPSCCRPSRARRSRRPRPGYTCPTAPSTRASPTTASPGR